MFLDLKTISIIFALITVLLCILMVFIWQTNRTYPGFRFWAFANISAAIGFVFLAAYGNLPEILTVIIANNFTFGSQLLSFVGNRKFLGLRSGWHFVGSLAVLNNIGLIYFDYFTNQINSRLICLSLLLVIVSLQTAYEFNRERRNSGNSSYAFASIVYLTFGFLMIVRASLLYFLPPDSISWIQPLSHITFIIYAVTWTFICLVLTNERLQQELKKTRAEFEKMATTDFLTGINNNRRFFEIGETEIQRARRFRHSLTLIMFDIDYFKKINDVHGHDAGDRVLMAIVEVCKFNLRELDALGRLGGEEFGILLPHTDIDVGKMVAGRLRRAFSETEIILAEKSVKVTASFGVTEFYETDNELKDLLNRADTALYAAKQNGRNQVKATSFINSPLTGNVSTLNSLQ